MTMLRTLAATTLTTAALVATTLGATAGPAAQAADGDRAGRADVGVNLRVSSQDFAFNGRVSSERAGCERTVDVVVFTDAFSDDGSFQRFVSGTTKRDGTYSISGFESIPGRYYSVVPRSENCQRAQSSTVRVRPL